MDRGLRATGHEKTQFWYHEEFEGIPPGHLADLEIILEHSIDS
jgi:hypothetical protein